MEEVKQWLKSGQDFRKGCLIYSKYGRKSSIALLKKNGENAMTRQALERMMKALVEDKSSSPLSLSQGEGKETASGQSEQVNKVPAGKSVEPDPVAAELQGDANKLYSEMGVLQARLSAILERAERAKVVRKFLSIQKEWANKLTHLEALLSAGKLPDVVSKKKAPLIHFLATIMQSLYCYGAKLAGQSGSKYLDIK